MHRRWNIGSKPTLCGHSGSSSQIDYILVKDSSLLHSVRVSEQLPTNMSSHVSVKASLNVSKDTLSAIKRSIPAKAVTKLQWEKVDEIQHQYLLEESYVR